VSFTVIWWCKEDWGVGSAVDDKGGIDIALKVTAILLVMLEALVR